MFMIDLDTDSYYSFFGLSPDATFLEIRDAGYRMYREVDTKMDNTSNPEEKRKLDEQLKEITAKAATLRRPDKRREYDKQNAHLRFFALQPAAAPIFVDKAERIHVMYGAVRRFLASRGVTLPPLSDLDRVDFTGDETPMEVFDSLLG